MSVADINTISEKPGPAMIHKERARAFAGTCVALRYHDSANCAMTCVSTSALPPLRVSAISEVQDGDQGGTIVERSAMLPEKPSRNLVL